MEEDSVRKQLLEDNGYFKKVLNLIPTQFYFDEDTKQMLREEGEQRNKGVKPEGEELSDKAVWKRKKFDPTHIKNVIQLQEHIIETEGQHKLKSTKKKKTREGGGGGRGGGGDLPLSASFHSQDELREKLHSRLETLKAKRLSLGKSDYQEKKKLRRKESKMQLKMRRKAEKKKLIKGQHIVNDINGITPKKSPAKKPIFNKAGKMVFSKFDFTDSGSKTKSDAPTGKDYKKLLEKVQRQKEKINRAKEIDESKGEEMANKHLWKTVLQKAEGIKVKDNPELLKKAMKKKDKMKERRKKVWEDRDTKVKTQMKDKQDKRKGNLQKRKQKRVDNKINRSKKKGHIVPGF